MCGRLRSCSRMFVSWYYEVRALCTFNSILQGLIYIRRGWVSEVESSDLILILAAVLSVN